ncbi:MAG: response regulator transcription factor [Planctomycetota bacterium]|nr:response regulator transcription factor [Planctomycetota bacterium]
MNGPTKATAKDVRILVVDDHSIVRRGLVDVIKREPGMTVCAEAASAKEAIQAIREHKPRLAIMDLSLQDFSGMELIKQIKAMDPAVSMIVHSIHDELLYAERALRAGAHGYVMKSEETEKLVAAIRTVVKGEIFVSDRMSSRILGRMMGSKVDINSQPIEMLSDRELEVFEDLGRGQGTRQIAEKLCVSIKTVESHRESIKTKLNLKTASELIHVATHWVMREGGT